jgi:hypothetical protein
MAVVETTTVNGLKALSLTTVPAVNITGVILIATGIVAIGTPIIIFGVRYIIKRVNKNKDGSSQITATSINGKVIMSLAVASTLMISVGTAMLPRTETVMIIHIVAGYTCLLISFVHVYQYRQVIKAQAKKYFNFLSAPKKPVAKNPKARVVVAKAN